MSNVEDLEAQEFLNLLTNPPRKGPRRPDFSAPGVDLYLGDSAVIVPELEQTFDLLVTDPPYNVEYQSGRRTATEKFEVMEGDRGEVDVAQILRACVSRLKPYRHVYVFGPDASVKAIEPLSAYAQLIWDKGITGMGDLNLPWGPSHEQITFAVHNPAKVNRDRGDGNLSARRRQGSILRAQRPNATGVRRHPSEKPVALMRQIIESSSCLGEVILEPFAGAGSTAVAALIEGRRVVAIEKDPKYFEVTKSRIEKLLPLLQVFESV